MAGGSGGVGFLGRLSQSGRHAKLPFRRRVITGPKAETPVPDGN